jgi:hypothetical protein
MALNWFVFSITRISRRKARDRQPQLFCSLLRGPKASHKGQSKASRITKVAETTSINACYKEAWNDGVIGG